MILSELILSKISEKSNRGQNFPVFFQVPVFFDRSPGIRGFLNYGSNLFTPR